MSPQLRGMGFTGPQQQRGAIGLMAAVTLGMVLLFMLLVIDSGRLYLEQRKLQRVADMAALEVVSRGGTCGSSATAVTFAKAVPAYVGKEDSLEKIFKLYVEHVYAKQAVLGHIDPQHLDKVLQFYVSEGIVTQATPLEDLFTNQFVDSPVAAQ